MPRVPQRSTFTRLAPLPWAAPFEPAAPAAAPSASAGKPSSTGQKIAIAPCEPCAVRIGKAEHSTAWTWPSKARTPKPAWAGRPPRTARTIGSSS